MLTKSNSRIRMIKALNVRNSGPLSNTTAPVTKGDAVMVNYGTNNKLPQEVIEVVSASGTAMNCWEMLDSFLQADGFSKKEEAVKEVNSDKETADALLDRISSDYSLLDGFALRIKYTAVGQVGEVYHVPFQTVRKLDDGTFLVNPTIGSKRYKKAEDEILKPFNTEKWEETIAEATDEIGSQKGQLWYVYRPTTATPIYPVPKFWAEAARLDIESDAQISRSDNKIIKRNFRPGGILFVPGLNTTPPAPGEMSEMDQAAEDVADLSNPENEGEIVLLTGENKEAAPQIIPFDSSKTLNVMDGKRDTIGRAVCRHMGVPDVLAGFATEGQLGNNQEMLNNISLFQSKVNRKQRVVQRVFQKLFGGDWTVSTLNIIKWLPPEMWATMTDEEKRNFGGFAESENLIDKETQKTIQALKALPEDLRKVVLDAMSPAQKLKMAGLTPETNTQDNADNQS